MFLDHLLLDWFEIYSCDDWQQLTTFVLLKHNVYIALETFLSYSSQLWLRKHFKKSFCQ